MDLDQPVTKPTPELSPNSRQRQSMEIRTCTNPDGSLKYSAQSILHAAMMVHKELGNNDASKIHKLLIDDPETNGKKLLDGFSTPSGQVTKLSNFQAMAYLLHNNVSADHYKVTKTKSDTCGAKWLPCYDYVNNEKPNCRPPEETVTITEKEASIPLKPLAVHTFERILKIEWVVTGIEKAKAASGSKENLLKLKAFLKVGNDT